MTASPLVQVQFSSDPGNWHDTPGGVDIVPGDTVSIRLSDTTSVGAWYVTVVGVDEFTATHPVLVNVSTSPDTLGLVVSPTSIVSFTPPAGHGRAYILRSSVNGPSSNTTFGIFVRTSDGFRVGAVGERFEGDPVFGWTTTLNQFIRSGGGGGGGPASALQTTTGNVDVAGSAAPSPGDVLTAVNSTHATWQSGGGGAPTGPAGRDLGGTYPNPEVVGLLGNQIVTSGGSVDLNLGLGADLLPGEVFGPLPGSGNPQKLVVLSQYDFIAIRQASVVVVNVNHADPTDFVSTPIDLNNSTSSLDLNLVTILNGVYDGSRYAWFVGGYNGTSYYLWKVDTTLASPIFVAYQLSLTLPSTIDQLKSITYSDGFVLVTVRDGHDSKYKILKINPSNGAILSVTLLPQLTVIPTPGIDLTIPVGSNPRGIGSDGTHVYTCNIVGSVSRILVSTGVVDLTISDVSITDPSYCLWDGGLYVYIANYSSGIARVSIATGLVHDTISIPGCVGMAKDNAGHIYAIDSTSNKVYKIRISDGVVLLNIDLTSLGTGYKYWIAFDNAQYMYVTDYTNGIIRIDVTTDSIFDTISYSGQSNPLIVEWDHAGYMYVGSDGSTLSRIKISDSTSQILFVGRYSPLGMAWDGDHHMYVACNGGGISVIDTTTFTQDNFISIGYNPWGAVWDGHTHIYVVDTGYPVVYRINISTTPYLTSVIPDTNSATSNADYTWFGGFLLSNQSRLSRFNPSTTVHKNNDTTNIETHPLATDLPLAQTLLNSLKAKYTAHLAQAGVHLVSDTDPLSSVASIPDATDSITSVTFPLCAALANDLKTKFNTHLTQSGVHAHNDTVSIITTPNATASSLSSIITLANAIGYSVGLVTLHGQYNAHLSQLVGGLSVHRVDDWVNTETEPQATDLSTLKNLLEDLAYFYTQHIQNAVSHNTIDAVNVITASTNLDADLGQYQTSTDLANALKSALNYHMLKAGVHYHYDQSLITTPDADSSSYTDLAGVIALANALGYGSTHGAFNAHLSRTRSLVHEQILASEMQTIPDVTGATSIDLMFNAENAVNTSQLAFNAHLVNPGDHQTNDTTNTSVAAPANDSPSTWWPTASALANDIKAQFNAHISNNGGAYHSSVDSGNLVTTPDSNQYDLLSIINLTNALGYATGYGAYNRHRIAVGGGIQVGNGPYAIAWDGGSYMYTINGPDGTISIVSISTTLVAATVTVDPNPNAIAWDGGLYMYVVCYGTPGSVQRVTISTQTVFDTIAVGNGPGAVAQCGSNMYVCNGGDGTISVIDIASGLVTSTITLTGTATPFPDSIIGITSNYIYVADASTNNAVIKVNVNTLVQHTLGVGLDPDSLAWDGNSTLYVANYGNDTDPGTITEIDLDSFTVLRTITAGRGVSGIAFDGGSPGFLYCTNYDDNTVSRIDASTGLVVSTITLGSNVGPNGIAWDDGAHLWLTQVNPSPGTLARIAVSTGTLVLGSFIHAINDQVDVEALPYDGSGAISATTLANVQARLNDLAAQYMEHVTNDIDNWHAVPDDTNLITAPTAADVAPTYPTTYALALELKTKFNAHLTQSGVHYNDDTTSTVTSTQSNNYRAFPAPDPANDADLTGIVNVIRALFTFGYYGVPTSLSGNLNGAYNFHLTQPIEFLGTNLTVSSGNTIQLKPVLIGSTYWVYLMAQDSSGVPYFYNVYGQNLESGSPDPHAPGILAGSWNITSNPGIYYPRSFTFVDSANDLWFISGGVPDETTLPYTLNRSPNAWITPSYPYLDFSETVPAGLFPTSIAGGGAAGPIRVSYGMGDYVGDLNDTSGARDEIAKYPMGGALGFIPIPPAGTWSVAGNIGSDEILPAEIFPYQNFGIFFDTSGTGNPLGIMSDKLSVRAVSIVPNADPTNPAHFDGVSLVNGDRVLLTRESPGNNGVRLFYYNSLYRFNIPWMTCGFQIYVTEGEIYGSKTFRQITTGIPAPPGSFGTQVWECEVGPHIAPPLTTVNGSGAGGTWVTLDTIPGPPANGYDLIVVTDSVATNTATGDNLQRERGAVTYHLAGGTLSLSNDSRSLTSTGFFQQVISGNSVLLQVGRQSSGNNYSFRIRAWFEYVRSV